MNDVVSQMSGIATENSAMSGLLSHAIWSRLAMRPASKSSSLTMPKLSMRRKRQSSPATTGAIMSGYMNSVRKIVDRLPSALNSSATARPSANSAATTMTV